MLRPRIIPCLLVHEGGLVKTVGFGSPKYVGDPITAVRIFNEKEVDELIVLDIDATVRKREPDYTMIANLAAECRMPLCYGGGVRTAEQIERIVNLGVEKALARHVRGAITRPMTVLGGAGSLKDVGDLVREFGIVGAAAGSLFVFKGVYRAVLINYPNRAAKDELVAAARSA